MTTMRRLLARPLLSVLCCIALVAIPHLSAVAQGETDSANLSSPINTNAVQFHLVGGPGLSFVAPLSNASGLRFSVDIDLNSFTLDRATTRTRFSSGSVIDSTNESRSDDGTSMGVDLTISYVRYAAFNDRIFGFAALGPVGGYSRYSSESTSSFNLQTVGIADSSEFTSTATYWRAGLRAALGLQAFLIPSISVLGEMQISGERLWSDRVEESRTGISVDMSRAELNETGWVFDIEAVRLGVAIHF